MPEYSAYSHRPITADDAALLLGWRNQPHIRQNMYSDHIISEAEHAAWLSRSLPVAENYRIFEHEGRAIGYASLYDVKPEHGRAYWAFYLGVNDAPKGSGSAMECFMLDHAFITRGLRKLCCEVFTFNDKVIAMHERFGFEREAFFKAHYKKGDAYADVVGLAMFKEQWAQRREEMMKNTFGQDWHG